MQGYNAFEDQFPRTDNPYIPNDPDYTLWDVGWEVAENDCKPHLHLSVHQMHSGKITNNTMQISTDNLRYILHHDGPFVAYGFVDGHLHYLLYRAETEWIACLVNWRYVQGFLSGQCDLFAAVNEAKYWYRGVVDSTGFVGIPVACDVVNLPERHIFTQ